MSFEERQHQWTKDLRRSITLNIFHFYRITFHSVLIVHNRYAARSTCGSIQLRSE